MDGFSTTVPQPLSTVEERVRELLSSVGFGVLTEIDVAATLRSKLGVERPPLKILGACKPQFAHRALQLDPSLALLLPCNVVVEALGERRTRVSAVDPRRLMGDGSVGGDDLIALASDAAKQLEQVIEQLGGVRDVGD